ncbi:MAG: 23S rRNA (uracil(1939)-C(5))-methyltransferase RlmD [Elusimicrobium sp.]|jgi:23S rRNA (uracil1939-C5)-methyltransferase|nr:23S rRNA (uracil(1939)-C(5))-methyltransferase RlmD [Elusimicrobium sp.]
MDLGCDAQVALKLAELRKLLAPFWSHDIIVHKSPAPEYYRNKIEVSFCNQVHWPEPFNKNYRREKGAPLVFETALGFKVKGTWDRAVDIEECIIFEPWLIPLLNAVRAWAKAENLAYYDGRKHTGVLRGMMMRSAKNTGQKMIVLITAQEIETAGFIKAVESVLPDANILHSVNISVSDGAGLADIRILKGRNAIEEKIILGDMEKTFRLSAQSFFQTNTLAAQEMYGRVREVAKQLKPQTIYDLYGGAGSFSLTCADIAEKLFCVENVPAATVDGEANAKLNDVKNVKFVCAQVEDYLRHNKLSAHNSLIILDPPRAGLHPAAVKAVAQSCAPDIVYISCNPVTLAQNLERMAENYTIKNIEAFDFFPNTKHIETLVELKLK